MALFYLNGFLKYIFTVLLIQLNLTRTDGVILDRQQLKAWNPTFKTDSTIYLFTRQIHLILDDSFEDLFQLKELFLHKNQLISLGSSQIFSSLLNLTKLDLGSNQLNSLHPLTFKSLTKLDSLSLYFNHLDENSMVSNVFESLLSLKILDLSFNKFRFFPLYLFDKLVNLNILYLHANQLISLETSLFASLINLTNLHLELNNLTRIE